MSNSDTNRAAVGIALAGLALGAAAAAHARPAGWPPLGDSDVAKSDSTIQITRSMSLDLPGSADAAFPLFGPVGESEWSPQWSPAFLVPTKPAQGPDGAVFTTGHDASPMTWVMTDFDPSQRVIRYVVFRPDRVAVQLWIEVTPVADRASRADVTYRYTALGPDGRDVIAHFVKAFPDFKAHWEGAIGPVLRAGARGGEDHASHHGSKP